MINLSLLKNDEPARAHALALANSVTCQVYISSEERQTGAAIPQSNRIQSVCIQTKVQSGCQRKAKVSELASLSDAQPTRNQGVPRNDTS